MFDSIIDFVIEWICRICIVVACIAVPAYLGMIIYMVVTQLIIPFIDKL
jgi:hypothetical protein